MYIYIGMEDEKEKHFYFKIKLKYTNVQVPIDFKTTPDNLPVQMVVAKTQFSVG